MVILGPAAIRRDRLMLGGYGPIKKGDSSAGVCNGRHQQLTTLNRVGSQASTPAEDALMGRSGL
jgi:hypothetical protein